MPRPELRYGRLEDALALHEAIFEGSRDAVFITDAESRLTAVNRAASELTGYSTAELLTMRIPDLHESADLHAYHAYHDRIMAGDEALTEAKILRKDGGKVDAEFNNRRIVIGGVLHMHTTARDITERKRAEEEVIRLNAELEKRVLERTAALLAANKELEAFSHSISHDLRAPLRAVIGFSRSLEDRCDGKLDDEGRRLLHVIRRNADRIGKLIDDLLVLSRAGRANLRRIRFAAGCLVEQVLREVLPEAERDRTEVLVADLPDMTADPNLVRQVFLNLLSNAVKFSSSRRDRVIEIGCRAGTGGDEFFVRDNGAGFDPRYADKLFKPFQRLHGENEFEGTGIGLSVVKRIVERHGGRVWAEGAVARGATFWFTLGAD